MDERLRFVARLLEGERMSPLCRESGISRKTGYKIFERYRDHGLEALTDRSRRPVRYANQLCSQARGSESRKSTTASGSSPSCTTILDISTWAENLAATRQPLRPRTVTHVLGTFCYLSLRAGQEIIWRTGRDSNPRYSCPYAAFRVRCFQPLSHLSVLSHPLLTNRAERKIVTARFPTVFGHLDCDSVSAAVPTAG